MLCFEDILRPACCVVCVKHLHWSENTLTLHCVVGGLDISSRFSPQFSKQRRVHAPAASLKEGFPRTGLAGMLQPKLKAVLLQRSTALKVPDDAKHNSSPSCISSVELQEDHIKGRQPSATRTYSLHLGGVHELEVIDSCDTDVVGVEESLLPPTILDTELMSPKQRLHWYKSWTVTQSSSPSAVLANAGSNRDVRMGSSNSVCVSL